MKKLIFKSLPENDNGENIDDVVNNFMSNKDIDLGDIHTIHFSDDNTNVIIGYMAEETPKKSKK